MATLSGIRVLDLSRYIAGPTASMMLADQGAEIIKVESLPIGDPSRQSGPFDDGQSVYFMSANRNKKSLALNMRSPEARSILRRLADQADVLIENFKPGTAEGMGLGFEELQKTNPRLIYCSISGFGAGPLGRSMAGFDQNAQGMSGLMSVTGTEETGPLRVGVPIADTVTGLIASFAITSKLMERERTGSGGVVRTSLMQSANFLLTYQAQKFLSLGIVAGREGNDHPLLYPQGTFRTQDGYLTIASGNEKMWRQLCGAMGLEDLAEHPSFATNEARLRNKTELRQRMEEVLTNQSASFWIKTISEAGVPCGEVLGIDEVYTHPIAEELRLAESVDHTLLGPMKVLGRPANTGSENWLRTAPPMLGEHNTEILQWLGFTAEEIAELGENGVLGGEKLPAATTSP